MRSELTEKKAAAKLVAFEETLTEAPDAVSKTSHLMRRFVSSLKAAQHNYS